jgi:MFS family permease
MLSESYRWRVLALATFTFTFVVAIPHMSLPVLFDEIAAELDLNLVQVGWIWGSSSVMGIFVGLIGGPLGDRFGPRRMLAVACLLMGLAGGARAFSTDFVTLAGTVFLTGFAQGAIPMNVHKACGVWFPRRQLGLANGVVSMGMALGFMLGAWLAAGFLSPLLNGWRNVLLAYAIVAIAFSLMWILTKEKSQAGPGASRPPIRAVVALRKVLALPQVWLLGLATALAAAGINSALGYLPLYLRDLGWAAERADQTLASFHGASLLFAIPIAMYSDRSGRRLGVLMICVVIFAAGFGAIGLVSGFLISAAVMLAGISRDGYMAVSMTTITEADGVGPELAGTAMGLSISLIAITNALAPPIGNSLVALGAAAPFYFWSALALLALLPYLVFKARARVRPREPS